MRFKHDSQIYAFTTENISGYFPLINFSGKDVLTVTASGDHAINAAMLGAGNVTEFDINQRAGFFAELKLAALDNLDFKSFKQFLLRGENGVLDFDVYRAIRVNLSREASEFFDSEYERFGQNGFSMRESDLFNNKHDNPELKTASNPYLQSERAYKVAQERCKQIGIETLTASVETIADKLRRPVDIVLLSNLADYAHESFSDDPLIQFRQRVIQPLTGRLAPEGIICAAYVYDTHDITPFRSSVDNPIERRRLGFEGVEYSESIFDSVIPGKKDLVVMLKLNCKEVKHGRTIQTVARA